MEPSNENALFVDKARAASRIKNDGLYALLLAEIIRDQALDGKSEDEIEAALARHPGYLDEYCRLNQEQHISNIDIPELKTSGEESGAQIRLKNQINGNISRLKELETCSAPASPGVIGIWIGSAAVLLVFAVHNIAAIFTKAYQEYPWLIYGLYVFMILIGALAHRAFVKSHNRRYRDYAVLHEQTAGLLEEAFESGALKQEELFGPKNTRISSALSCTV